MQALARSTSQALERKAKSAKWLRSHRFRTESCALSQMKNVQRSAQWFQNFQNDYISAKWFCSQLFHKERCDVCMMYDVVSSKSTLPPKL